jgi:hypothetical protein
MVLACSAVVTNAGQRVTNVSKSITFVGIGGVQSGTLDLNLNLAGQIRQELEVDAQFAKGSAINQARVPASGVPRPGGNALAPLDANFFGFPGVNHLQQRLADNGHQFSLEPPDPDMAVGPEQVVNAVNTAIAVYDKSGHMQGIAAFNPFFGLPSEVVTDSQGNSTYGPFMSDPRVIYDASTGAWIVSVAEIDTDPATGAFLNTAAVYLAVSQTSDPTGPFNIYRLDTSDVGAPDQPLIGVDAHGLYVSINGFSLPDLNFEGGLIYALSKSALISGTLGSVIRFDGLTQAEGPGYSIQPANIPPDGVFVTANGGTEYFLSALDFNATLDNRVTVWAITGTASLDTSSPSLGIQNAVLNTIVYGQPPNAQQRPGPTPLGDLVQHGAFGKHYGEILPNLLAANDDRMNAVVYAAGCLWGGVNTVVKTPNGPTRVGVVYFVVMPSWNNGSLSGNVVNADYVSVNQENLLFPAIAVNNSGKGIIAFTLVGPGYFPSAAYAPLSMASGAGAVRIAGPGVEPADGFTGYKAFQGTGVERWGDYHTAVVDPADGSFWFTAQCNLGGPRSLYANWSTFIGRVSY